jgi:hypothetical protein
VAQQKQKQGENFKSQASKRHGFNLQNGFQKKIKRQSLVLALSFKSFRSPTSLQKFPPIYQL